jgi:hypothetical protein
MTRLLLLARVAFLGAVSVVLLAGPAVPGALAGEKGKPKPREPLMLTVGVDPVDVERARRIEEELKKPTQMEFVETPLQDIIDFLKNFHGVEIQLDKKALDEAGVGTDTPITKNLKGISLRSALRLVLSELELTYMIRGGVLLITTQEQADSRLYTVIYEVADLVTCRDDMDRLWDDYDTLVDLITSTVVPTTWDEVGGAGSIAPASFAGARVLVVTQNQEVQDQIIDLLRKLRYMMHNSGQTLEPPRRNPKSPEKQKAVTGKPWGWAVMGGGKDGGKHADNACEKHTKQKGGGKKAGTK